MSDRPVTIFISAGEVSGDMHAAGLIEALRRQLRDVRIVGVGGPEMARAGCEPAVKGLDLTAQASMLTGPLTRLGYYRRAIRSLQNSIAQIRPDVHVPVDSPALNWHLAATAKQVGAKVAYYVAPQLWAWAPWRIHKLARLTDHVACILPFEQDWLRERHVKASYVGHPLFDSLPDRPENPPDLLDAWSHGTWQVALLAGSRPSEITKHVKALATAAEAIKKRWPASVCTFAAGNEQSSEMILKRLGGRAPEGVEIVTSQTSSVLRSSHFAIAVSGTVTLQAAYFGVPMVVLYRVGRLPYSLLGRWLIRTPRLSLVNVLAGRKLVPELMPWHGSIKQLNEMTIEVMDDVGYLAATRKELTDLADTLRAPGSASAADNVAKIVLDLL